MENKRQVRKESKNERIMDKYKKNKEKGYVKNKKGKKQVERIVE